ncbi:glucans biosynthesis glucosyltransferase MdoH [Brevundimonas sp. FT23028]|uniref:glucans biosynthesis glucosyltransferase MdoH n=1 Tax=Brevundimonas sp. FT23028 TaxID=3393748 RepID=UPI003B5874D0
MTHQAIRIDAANAPSGLDERPAWTWLPEEAPLAMPRQSLNSWDATPEVPTPATSPVNVAGRRLALAGLTAFVTALALIAPMALFARNGFDTLEVVSLCIFGVLITAIGCWFSSAAIGFWVLLTGREQDDLDFAPHPPEPGQRTALLMPLYNEDARAAFARLSVIDSSLARLGVSDAFDIFVLSDSTRAEAADQERQAYLGFRAHAHSRVFYRRREKNIERKCGNLAEWTQRFGAAYPFMLVLDADSTMAGETILRMVDAMERNPGIGLLQTTPTIIKGQTLFARISQFSVRLYGRVAAAGLAWWAGSEASYWGHNAILRTEAFASTAHLPILPGREPFGGAILSHDTVEAALLRRAGWAVHVTAALDGSCEETPSTMLDFIRRDHRWCQGNMQHLGLLKTRSMTVMNRVQMAMGFMAYFSSPLWLASLIAGMIIQLQYPTDWSSFAYLLHPEFSPFMLATLLSGVLLIGPKVMGGLLVMSRPRERRAFGGGKRIARGMAVEIMLSALIAPIMMVANTKAILQIAAGHDAGWHAQDRDADGVSWADAFRSMRWQMGTGLLFCIGLGFRPDLVTWFAPVVLPLLLSAPIVVLTSRRSLGEAAAKAGFLAVPDEAGVSVSTIPSAPQASALRAVAGA